MKTYRISYEGYLEDDFETENEAILAFIDNLKEDIEKSDSCSNIKVEVFNDDKEEWE